MKNKDRIVLDSKNYIENRLGVFVTSIIFLLIETKCAGVFQISGERDFFIQMQIG